MKTEWLCDDCYKQTCFMLGVREIEQYTDLNILNQICPNCKNKIEIHHLDRYKMCLYCKFWRFIRKEDFKSWKGPHGECNKITDYSQDDEPAWLDSYTTYPDYDGKLQEQNIIYPIRMTHDLAGNELIQSSALITKPNFGCNLFEDKE